MSLGSLLGPRPGPCPEGNDAPKKTERHIVAFWEEATALRPGPHRGCPTALGPRPLCRMHGFAAPPSPQQEHGTERLSPKGACDLS